MPSFHAKLSMVDQMNPSMYTAMWLIFENEDPEAAAAAMQKGLDRTVSQLPFLSGNISLDPSDKYRSSLSWSDDDPKVQMEEVVAEGIPDYQQLAANAWNLHALDIEIRPKTLLNAMSADVQPSFIASYTKLSGGLIVLLAPHHAMIDGGARQLLFKVIADNVRGVAPRYKFDPQDPMSRARKLDRIVDSILSNVELNDQELFFPPVQLDDMIPKEQDLSTTAVPTCSKILTFSVRRLDALRRILSERTRRHFSLNTLVMTLLWTSISVAKVNRMRRASPAPMFADPDSELIIAMNTRKVFEQAGLIEKDTWLGNLATSITPRPKFSLGTFDREAFEIELPVSAHNSEVSSPASTLTVPVRENIPELLDAVTDKLSGMSKERIAAGFAKGAAIVGYDVSEYLAEPDADYRPLRKTTVLADGLNLGVTNWGALDLLPDYGPVLGLPACARVLSLNLDGFAVMLPRHRTADAGVAALDRFEAMLSLRNDDMQVVLQDKLLNALLSSPPV